jgi:hypothetical protein
MSVRWASSVEKKIIELKRLSAEGFSYEIVIQID